MVFLAVMASLPLVYKLIIYEEQKDLEIRSERSLLKEHSKALTAMMLMFLGMAIAFTILYIVLPQEMTSEVFRVQSQTIANLNQQVTGKVSQTTLLSRIFLNNIKVLIFCIIFSFIYGSGALFILTWNASVIGTAAGNFIRTRLAQYASAAGLQKMGAFFYVGSLCVLRYLIHGIPEILAYFVAALAGGIISVAIIRKEYTTKNFQRVVLDVSDLVLLSVLILFIAALLEVFVTPALF
ncbi:MAG TPA: stage II sporulation protein M [Candidatus Woesearchaeota archaeon]|nr:stage II sporulation protein M [Candidatus Woesearchaeota archaeon]